MPAGTHWCALYSDPAERDRFSFLREGLQHGDRCLCLVDHLEEARVLELTMRQVSVEIAGESHHPDVRRASDVCLQAGQFSVDRTTSFLADSANHAAETGFPHLRLIVEMGWLLRQPQAVDDLLLYESAVAPVVEQVSAMVMRVRPALFRCGDAGGSAQNARNGGPGRHCAGESALPGRRR